MPSKKVANEENRARLEDHMGRRPSPPRRMESPRDRYRRSDSESRREEIRRAQENYHPSEAAHRPPTLPSIQNMSSHNMADGPREERKEQIEPPARKMDVDENYDDEGDEEKRNMGSGGGRNSPQGGMMNGPSKADHPA